MTKKTTYLICAVFALTIFFQQPFICLSQTSDTIYKILVVEKTTLNKFQKKPNRHYLHKGSLITVNRYSNDTILKGSIKTITDSTIEIKHKTVPLKDIKGLNTYRRGIIIATSGATIFLVSAALVIYFSPPYSDSPSNNDSAAETASAFVVAGLVVTLIGVIDLFLSNHYDFDKNYRLYVLTNEKK